MDIMDRSILKCISENSRRLRIKNLIKEISLENKDVRRVIFNSIKELLN